MHYSDFKIEEFNDLIKSLKKEHKKSRHICFSYIYTKDNQTFVKYSDDGEPKGTAGLPIYNVIKNNNLTNDLIVVIRYFGGKKLGASKLLRTYSKAANLLFK